MVLKRLYPTRGNDMDREREALQIWLSWILGAVAGSLICALFFGVAALEIFLVCALVGYFLVKRVIGKRESQPILV